jgi:hypothetical protein
MLKTERLTLRVLAAHKMALERMAQTEGEPVAVVLRRLIRAEAERKGVWPVKNGQHRLDIPEVKS